METSSIVPDVIDTMPSNIMKVIYTSGCKADLGNELTPTQVKSPPNVDWPTESDQLYTLIMLDADSHDVNNDKLDRPDYPDHSGHQTLHWLVVNSSRTDPGQTVTGYMGSVPTQGTGYHRYVFLVYKHRHRIVVPVTDGGIKCRKGFNLREFVQFYALGDPVAANFYRAKFDDYVPVLKNRMLNKTRQVVRNPTQHSQAFYWIWEGYG